MLVDAAQAEALFLSLPADMQWPSLSPMYVAADAVRDPSLRPLFMAARQGDGLLLHAVHEAFVPERNDRDWQSAYGYGGPIAFGLDDAALAEAWRELDASATAHRVVAEFVRFHPALENHRHYPGPTRHDRAVVMIDLGATDLLASYDGRARTAIRKAERDGLRAVWEPPADACAAFAPFYRRSMAEIGASDFYMFGDAYFSALLALPGARVLSVMRGDDRLSMGLFLFGPSQVEYHLSGTSPPGRAAGATNLLLHVAARTAQDSGRSRFYLGGGTSSRDDDPLLRFKTSFAPGKHSFRIGHRIHEPQLYAQLKADAAARGAAPSSRILFYRS